MKLKMNKLNLKSAFQTILKKDKPKPIENTSLPSHLKKYPNFKFNRNKIINFYYKPKGKLNFDDTSSLPQKLKFTRVRTSTKIKEVM